jgi:hypothetical protein
MVEQHRPRDGVIYLNDTADFYSKFNRITV